MAQWKGIVGKSFTAAAFPAYVAQQKFDQWRPQFVVLHNTASPKLSQWHSAPGEQRMKNLVKEIHTAIDKLVTEVTRMCKSCIIC